MPRHASAFVLCALAWLFLCTATPAWAQRVALVVGNGAYRDIGPLKNSASDARLVGDTLQALGFAVSRHEDLGLEALNRVVREFGVRAHGAEVAVVYFAGHGLQLQRPGQPAGENYLLPVDARLGDVRDVPRQALALQEVLDELAGAQVAIVLLDACRDNPAAARMAGLGTRAAFRSGLAPVPDAALQGVVLGFAAAPGAVANDGAGRNSPYAAALARRLRAPGEDVGQVLRRVRADVWEATRNQPAPQLPEFVDRRTTGDSLLLAGLASAPVPQPKPVPLPPGTTEPGNAVAQFELGTEYRNGVPGVPQDDREAVRLYRLAADQGEAVAQYNLGVMYANGRGVPRDEREAARLYRLAADQGIAVAQTNLGLMYANGRGVPLDDREAVRFFRLAADQGFVNAQYSLGVMYLNGRGVPRDDREAVRRFRLAADQGYAAAQTNLGLMYANGRGVPRDEREAVRLYRLAADQGNAVAQTNLGLMYEGGRGVPRDEREAARLYRLAAAQGNAHARQRLQALGERVP